jgi:NAD(P)-dependent dehydrogenase (short-subunit alcohol dehydrogenase family)
MPGFPGYSATKAGLVRLIETLSLDFADFEIFINVLGPGPFTSPIFEQAHQESNIHASFSKNRNKNTQEPPLINTHNTCKVIARMISAEFDGISGNFLSAQWDDWSESPMKLIQHRECNHHLKLRRVKC